jgi:hypothetical protein
MIAAEGNAGAGHFCAKNKSFFESFAFVHAAGRFDGYTPLPIPAPDPPPTDTLPRTVSAAVGLVRSAPVPVRPGHASSAQAQGPSGSIGALLSRGRCGSPKNAEMLFWWRCHICHRWHLESVAVCVAVLWLPIGPAKLLIYKGVAPVAIVAVRSQEHIYIRIIMYTVYNPKPPNAFLMALPQLPRRVKRHRHRKATD